MLFDLTILGCNAALPNNGRHPTSQVLTVQDKSYLIDCGEGTQMRMNDFHIKRGRINQIFISHLHGDHVFGLIGLLTSYSLNGRNEALEIFGPEGLEEFIKHQLTYTKSTITYPLSFQVVDTTQHSLIYQDNQLNVYSIPLVHRVPATGYLFREKKRKPNIIAAKLKEYNIHYSFIEGIKDGNDFKLENGQVVPNSELLLAAPNPRSYAFCSDTMYNEAIIPIIKGVDLLYHEATFDHTMLTQANKTMHTTSKQAGEIALKAEVKQLIIGHYSSRYKNLTILLDEAKSIFPNTHLAEEGRVYPLVIQKNI